MPFQLVISSGAEAGREFVFDSTNVLIGRTDECDVILYETGISRKHARLYEENGQHFIEDLGSSNGTHVNGERVVTHHPLVQGDTIRLGTISFIFSPTAPETRVVSVGEIQRSRNQGVASVPKDQSSEELQQLGRLSTAMLPAVEPAKPSGPQKSSGARRALSPPPPDGLVQPGSAPIDEAPTDATLESHPKPLPVPLKEAQEDSEARELSAAERMRLRRHGGDRGPLKTWWVHAHPLQKMLAVASGVVLICGLAIGATAAYRKSNAGRDGIEPNVMGPQPAADSFGLGEGVTWPNADKKDFQFALDNTAKRVALVHFQSQDISAGEVTLTLNGGTSRPLEADLVDAATHEHELVFGPSELMPGKVNIVSFDNVKNPPKDEPWRVWNVWLELIPLPDLGPDLLVADAEQKYKLGLQKLEQRTIYIGNLWQGYSALRDAWLYLEAVPLGNMMPTYEVVRAQMREARKLLDDKCIQLLRQAKGEHARGDYRSFDATLTYLKEVFPSRLHPCPSKAEYLQYQLENE